MQAPLCPVISNVAQQAAITNKPYPDAIYLSADKGTIRSEGVSSLQGGVIIQQNDTQFNADNALFDRKTNLVTAQGHVILSTSELKLKSESIQYNLKNHTGTIEKAEYSVGAEGAHGKANRSNKLTKVSYH